MDNPVFFTVLTADEEGLAITDAGILGSRRAAEAEAERRHERLPGLRHVAVVVSILDQDPATGTPIPRLEPRMATGFALASLSVAEPERRYIVCGVPIFEDFPAARHAADTARAWNLERGNNLVRDVVALTVLPKTAGQSGY